VKRRKEKNGRRTTSEKEFESAEEEKCSLLGKFSREAIKGVKSTAWIHEEENLQAPILLTTLSIGGKEIKGGGLEGRGGRVLRKDRVVRAGGPSRKDLKVYFKRELRKEGNTFGKNGSRPQGGDIGEPRSLFSSGLRRTKNKSAQKIK